MHLSRSNLGVGGPDDTHENHKALSCHTTLRNWNTLNIDRRWDLKFRRQTSDTAYQFKPAMDQHSWPSVSMISSGYEYRKTFQTFSIAERVFIFLDFKLFHQWQNSNEVLILGIRDNQSDEPETDYDAESVTSYWASVEIFLEQSDLGRFSVARFSFRERNSALCFRTDRVAAGITARFCVPSYNSDPDKIRVFLPNTAKDRCSSQS